MTMAMIASGIVMVAAIAATTGRSLRFAQLDIALSGRIHCAVWIRELL